MRTAALPHCVDGHWCRAAKRRVLLRRQPERWPESGKHLVALSNNWGPLLNGKRVVEEPCA